MAKRTARPKASDNEVLVEFIRDTEAKEGPAYTAGQVVAIPATSLERWQRRGAVKLAKKPTPKKVAKAEHGKPNQHNAE